AERAARRFAPQPEVPHPAPEPLGHPPGPAVRAPAAQLVTERRLHLIRWPRPGPARIAHAASSPGSGTATGTPTVGPAAAPAGRTVPATGACTCTVTGAASSAAAPTSGPSPGAVEPGTVLAHAPARPGRGEILRLPLLSGPALRRCLSPPRR